MRRFLHIAPRPAFTVILLALWAAATTLLPPPAAGAPIPHGPGRSGYKWHAANGDYFFVHMATSLLPMELTYELFERQVRRLVRNRAGEVDSHKWNNRWYWRRVPRGRTLILYIENIATNQIYFAGIDNRRGNTWTIMTSLSSGHSGVANFIFEGQTFNETVTMGSAQVRISFRNPRNSRTWGRFDIHYRIGP